MIVFTNTQKIHIATSIKDEVDKVIPSKLTKEEKHIMQIIMRGVADAILNLPVEN